MISRFITNNKISLYTESIGNASNPCVLLIMGATAQAVMWEDDFCQNLASHGFFVIRYDHRDTGKSDKIDYKAQPYLLSDLADDALLILDSYNIKKTYIIAASMGSFISQYIAVTYPEKILGLCLVMSSPNHHAFVDGFEGKGVLNHELPASHKNILKFYQSIIGISGSSIDEIDTLYRKLWLQIENHEDEDLVNLRINEGKILRRLKNSKYVHNHSFALTNSPSLENEIHRIKCPTLLIHGELDYILPVEHSIKLSSLIKHSSLNIYKKMGHSFNNSILKKIASDFIIFFSQRH